MQNIEIVPMSLQEEAQETQRRRNSYKPLRVVSNVENAISNCTNTRPKELVCFSGMLGVAVLAAFIDGKFGITASELLAVFGGAMAGNDTPLISGPINFFKDKKAIKTIRARNEVSVDEIASLLLEYPDVVNREEVELWPKKLFGESSLEHPDRYKLFKAILENNLESPEVIVDKFIQAEILAQQIRRSRKYMQKEALMKLEDIFTGILITTGVTNALVFGLGLQSEAGFAGLGDDAFSIAAKESRAIKNRVKSFFSKF